MTPWVPQRLRAGVWLVLCLPGSPRSASGPGPHIMLILRLHLGLDTAVCWRGPPSVLTSLGPLTRSLRLSASPFPHLCDASRPSFTEYFLRVVRQELSYFFLEGPQNSSFGGLEAVLVFHVILPLKNQGLCCLLSPPSKVFREMLSPAAIVHIYYINST